mgnify:CR=1 FL=1
MNTLLNELYTAAMPLLLQALSAVLMALLLWAGNTARERWGMEISARRREALHSALMSGILAALGRGLSGQDAVRAAIDHATKSTPDAIRKLKPAPGVLESIAEGKLGEVMGVSGAPYTIGGGGQSKPQAKR